MLTSGPAWFAPGTLLTASGYGTWHTIEKPTRARPLCDLETVVIDPVRSL